QRGLLLIRLLLQQRDLLTRAPGGPASDGVERAVNPVDLTLQIVALAQRLANLRVPLTLRQRRARLGDLVAGDGALRDLRRQEHLGTVAGNPERPAARVGVQAG